MDEVIEQLSSATIYLTYFSKVKIAILDHRIHSVVIVVICPIGIHLALG
jgi:hypothetical protein